MESHNRWTEKFSFGFPICVDQGKKVAMAYGVVNPLGGVKRSVFIVDKQGKVAWAAEGMPSTEELLTALDTINPGA